jgi:transposase/ferredoxin
MFPPASISSVMNWIHGWDRQQVHLLPAQVEDYVDQDNPVRFLDAFVDSQDLRAKGFKFPKDHPQDKGRPAYHPGDLLKLYLYGYVHGIRSSRKLERQCRHNLEVIWLVRGLAPDFKTIADFRKNNGSAFKSLNREFTQLCQQLDLFGRQLLAIDGTKIKAQNARDQNWSQSKLEKQLQTAQQRLEKYLKDLEEADAQEEVAPEKVKGLQEKIQRWKAQEAKAREGLDILQKTEQSQLSATDPDSRGMKGNSGHMVGYNVQGAVDAKHHMMVVLEATNHPTDQGQLATVAHAAKETLQIEQADLTADGGYFKNEDIKKCQEMGMEPHVPEAKSPPEVYGKKDFAYDAANNTYRCPAGAILNFRRQVEDKGTVRFNYDNPVACVSCALKARCTKSEYRVVSRWEHDDCIERMKQKMAACPEKLAKRKTLIEHPWGTIKYLLSGGFLVKGLPKVQAETSLVHFAYNLKRALQVVGLGELMKAIQE